VERLTHDIDVWVGSASADGAPYWWDLLLEAGQIERGVDDLRRQRGRV
jgi:hypothetical protein